MHNGATNLQPVQPEPGRPLYVTVRDSLRAAIDAGQFKPGEQMPSTKLLSEQMRVSLVTAHRALQELVACGVLNRAQGRGTFVHERYPERKEQVSSCRVGLVFHRESSLADYYHSQILEGVRLASNQSNVDLVLLRFGEDVRNECDGFLFVNPLPQDLNDLPGRLSRQPVIVVGAQSTHRRIYSVDVDNHRLASEAVQHLFDLGHRKLMFVGGDEMLSNSRDRREGFLDACERRGCVVNERHTFSAASWRLSESERKHMHRLLSEADRPTAIFAAGYYLALDAYAIAQQAGLRVPTDVSIVGVDDPPSAMYLSPPLTTMRQPLVEVGQQSIRTMLDLVQDRPVDAPIRLLRAHLVARTSTGPISADLRR